MNQNYGIAIGLSVLLHIAVALLLGLGSFFAPEKTQQSAMVMEANVIKPIDAVAVDKQKLQQQVDRIVKEKADARSAEERRVRELEQRAINAKKSRQSEQDRITNLEQQRKKKEQEKQDADKAAETAKAKAAMAEQERKAKEAEKLTAVKAAEAAKEKRLKEEAAAKKAQQLREQQEADRQRKVQEAKERAEQQRLLEQQMAEEMASRQQARKQQMMSEIQRYTALISQTITRNLITDRSTMEGKSCKLTISLAPSGFVKNVVLGAGARAVCDAAQKAIYKAGTLPVSSDPEVFKEMSTISLTVVPEFN